MSFSLEFITDDNDFTITQSTYSRNSSDYLRFRTNIIDRKFRVPTTGLWQISGNWAPFITSSNVSVSMIPFPTRSR